MRSFSHANGIETYGASLLALGEYTQTVVLKSELWLQWTKTFPARAPSQARRAHHVGLSATSLSGIAGRRQDFAFAVHAFRHRLKAGLRPVPPLDTKYFIT